MAKAAARASSRKPTSPRTQRRDGRVSSCAKSRARAALPARACDRGTEPTVDAARLSGPASTRCCSGGIRTRARQSCARGFARPGSDTDGTRPGAADRWRGGRRAGIRVDQGARGCADRCQATRGSRVATLCFFSVVKEHEVMAACSRNADLTTRVNEPDVLTSWSFSQLRIL